ncbi:MAG TPA: RHS repeat-associated core domain-containing protein, partial [Pyrinomonadaceae bacterium]|nr:RHS repeat-associated core domain-containing protein [Pyrinomonadaceae bacterium]
PSERKPEEGLTEKRLIEHARTLDRSDDMTSPLALGRLETLALPFESYKLAFTPGLLAEVYGARVTEEALKDEGRYVRFADDDGWWIPSGRIFFSPDTSHKPPEELAYARAHFFLPLRRRDPFHIRETPTESFISYDRYDLLIEETRDALGNRVTVGERDASDRLIIESGNDYRVLQPSLLMDANRNRARVAFDALGMVAATALMGKPEDQPALGDRLEETFRADLTRADIARFFDEPKGPAARALLGDATTRFVYDLTAFMREPDARKKPPVFVATLARETHATDPEQAGGLKIQVSFSYSDGLGREIQKKMQAEPGPVPRRDPVTGRVVCVDGRPETIPHDGPRWAGSGWTVFNNKGKPVRRYEPFFTDTHRFEFDVRVGVSLVFLYDPVERLVATLHPNDTWEKVVFDAWSQTNWDTNDTATITDPATDREVGDFFKRLPEANPFTSWHDARKGGKLGEAERQAGLQSAVHADTPTVIHLDCLGRPFLTVAHNKQLRTDEAGVIRLEEEWHASHVELDIEGNQRAVRDAMPDASGLGRVVMRYDYDMLGRRARQASMDAGARWTLNDMAGKPILTWDERGHTFRNEYDELRRPRRKFVKGALPKDPTHEILFEHVVYGDSRDANLTNEQVRHSNLRTRVHLQHDGAGLLTNEAYDFKGNLLRSTRQLPEDYKDPFDWKQSPSLESEVFASASRFDALNRVTQQTAPHVVKPESRLSVVQPAYNEANLLERVDVWQGLAAEPETLLDPNTATLRPVTNIDYNARGQRELIAYGNRAQTRYTYDPDTFRLKRLVTRRNAEDFSGDCPDEHATPCGVQNRLYTYDPSGNVTQIADGAQPKIYFNNEVVSATAHYVYDALYRLVGAEGREHAAQSGRPRWPTWDDALRTSLPHPGDGRALRNYCEAYRYDAAGNIREVVHRAADGNWTRAYEYDGANLAPSNNRLTATTVGDGANAFVERYAYDPHGNMTFVPHAPGQPPYPPQDWPPPPGLEWDFKDQLCATQRQVRTDGGTPERTYYVYDSAGQRVRKVTEGEAVPGARPAKVKERIYLGGFEIYREYDSAHAGPALERETLHVTDGQQRVALLETKTVTDGTSLDAPATLTRYQLGNHLGSVCLELDASAAVITYEEFYPYGGTSYQAARTDTEVPPKRYRYSAKERDEETGLYYYGARYYAPWLGRWTSCDPQENLNRYQFVSGNPCRLFDPDGKWEQDMHFMGVYMAARFAGVSHKEALKGAVFSQAADDKLQYDAKPQKAWGGVKQVGGAAVGAAALPVLALSLIPGPGLFATAAGASVMAAGVSLHQNGKDTVKFINNLHALNVSKEDSERVAVMGAETTNPALLGLGLHTVGDYLSHANTTGNVTFGHQEGTTEMNTPSHPTETWADKTQLNPGKAAATFERMAELWSVYQGGGASPQLTALQTNLLQAYLTADDPAMKAQHAARFLGTTGAKAAEIKEALEYFESEELRVKKFDQEAAAGQGKEAVEAATSVYSQGDNDAAFNWRKVDIEEEVRTGQAFINLNTCR